MKKMVALLAVVVALAGFAAVAYADGGGDVGILCTSPNGHCDG